MHVDTRHPKVFEVLEVTALSQNWRMFYHTPPVEDLWYPAHTQSYLVKYGFDFTSEDYGSSYIWSVLLKIYECKVHFTYYAYRLVLAARLKDNSTIDLFEVKMLMR